MGKLIAFEFISLDGFMAGPPGEEMDFVVSAFSEAMERDLADQYQSVDAFVMGKTTFQSLASYWPTPAANNELLQDTMNSMEKLVCSTSMSETHWQHSRILSDNIVSEISKRKQLSDKDMMIIGSASLVQKLNREQLIDEYRFFLFPSVLGVGKRLFTALEERQAMQLMTTKTFSTGVVRLDYQPA